MLDLEKAERGVIIFLVLALFAIFSVTAYIKYRERVRVEIEHREDVPPAITE